jgi:hypothetical protein
MAAEVTYHNRRAVQIENDILRLTVTVEGGHIAEILDKASGVNPLWIPPWRSIEPSIYSAAGHPEYGANVESRLLCGIMGHNLCLDLFGPPSEEEAAAGVDVHGEASVVPYEITVSGAELTARCRMPIAQLAFERHIRLVGRRLAIVETVENLSALDRPIAWTQHVTLGPPFLERGATQFRAPSVKSQAIAGSPQNLELCTGEELSGGVTTHLMDPGQEQSYFTAWSPSSQLALGYVWRRADFPWLGVWEENRSRAHAPWNGLTLTRGMEFGVSPVPETRKQMIERGKMFDTPGYRWIPARSRIRAEYHAGIAPARTIPDTLDRLNALILPT